MPPFAVLAIIAQVVATTPDPVMTYGPWAVLTSAVGILWKLHMDSDARERALTDQALSAGREVIAAVNKLADVIDADRAERAEPKARR